MRVVDNLIALRIVYLLVTPFQNTDAYKLGLISNKGAALRKASTSKEKNSTSMLHRLVWNLKKIINLAPGGSTKIGSLAAAYLLIKEATDRDWSVNKLMEEATIRYDTLSQITFLDEEMLIEGCLEMIEYMAEDAPANAAGAAVSTETPMGPSVVKKKKLPKVGRALFGVTG